MTTHDRGGYQRGCRCELCCEANRAYSRERRHRKTSEIHASMNLAAVPEANANHGAHLPTLSKLDNVATPRGRVVEAVGTDLANANAFEERPGLASVAMAMAELLDNPSATPQWPAAAARLTAILLEVIPAVPARRSGLQAVKDLAP